MITNRFKINTKFTSKLFDATMKYSTRTKSMSQILCYPDPIAKDKSSVSACKSLKLMLSRDLIKHTSPGIFIRMPLTNRSLEKLCNLVDESMNKVNAQKVAFPTLIQDSLLKTSGRWEGNDNLFKLKDKHSCSYCLGPTHEEVATSLMAKLRISYKSLPLRLYQISDKFRDEAKPKLGLLRGREFVMKDLYTFDSTVENSKLTYSAICDVYQEFFKMLDIEPVKVKGSSGDIGGQSSHEFHFPLDIGEDEIYFCPKCRQGINGELHDGKELTCTTCDLPMQKENGVEVGHAFLLGTTYSKNFKAHFTNAEDKCENMQMGCYGLGLTRILAASLEHFSSTDNIRWPFRIAPYYVTIIPPKRGSKEESVRPFADSLVETLNKIDWLSSNVLIDDRTNFTIGKRVHDASAIGIPYVIVVGKLAQGEVPKLEVIDIYKNQTHILSHKETLLFFRNKFLFQNYFA